MTAPRSRRSPFRNVEVIKTRGATAARLTAIVSQDEERVRITLDGLTEGHSQQRTAAILRRVVRACADRLGLTIETSTFMAALATDASLVATRGQADAVFNTEQSNG